MSHDTSANLSQKVRMSKIDQNFALLQDEIYEIYVKNRNTLPKTIEIIESRYGFKPSPRTWKAQLKTWGFDKNLTSEEMGIVVAKKEKRAREGKQTIFFHGETEISDQRIENFKKRKRMRDGEVGSPKAETPANVTYHTPGGSSSITGESVSPSIQREENEKDDVDGISAIVHQELNEVDNSDGISEVGHDGSKGEFSHPNSSDAPSSLDIPPSLNHDPRHDQPRNLEEEAIASIGSVCHLPDSNKLRAGDNAIRLAKAYVSQGRYQEAISVYRKTIHNYGRLEYGLYGLRKAECRRSLAFLEAREGSLDQAVRTLILVLPYHLENNNYKIIGDIIKTILQHCELSQPSDKKREALLCLNNELNALVGLLGHTEQQQETTSIRHYCGHFDYIYLNVINWAKSWDDVPELEDLAKVAIEKLRGVSTGKNVWGHLLWCHHLQLQGRWVEAYEILHYAHMQLNPENLSFHPRELVVKARIVKALKICQHAEAHSNISIINSQLWHEKTTKMLQFLCSTPSSRLGRVLSDSAEADGRGGDGQLSGNNEDPSDLITVCNDVDNDVDNEEAQEAAEKDDETRATVTTRSHRYGISFSVSEITGVSNSVFYSDSVRGG